MTLLYDCGKQKGPFGEVEAHNSFGTAFLSCPSMWLLGSRFGDIITRLCKSLGTCLDLSLDKGQ